MEYKVQPAVIPFSKDIPTKNSWIAKTDNQNAKLFRRGVAKSKNPNNAGACRFPNADIIPGMTNKKTIPKPCAVTAR